mgnify:CR=1 FL=1
MNIEQICEYLNEIGILDMNTIKDYLTLTTNILNENRKYKSINDIYKISLFAFLRGANNDDKALYFLCSNIINSYNRYNLIKKFKFLNHFKKLLYYKICQRFNCFIMSLSKRFYSKRNQDKTNCKSTKKIRYNNTCSNRFYSKGNNSIKNISEINNLEGYNTPNYKNMGVNDILFKNKDVDEKNKKINTENRKKPNINKNNFSPLKIENYYILGDKKIYRELSPKKKSKRINNEMCIAQSNINFDKYFINKRNIICKKSRPSFVESILNNKRAFYNENKNRLRKNKSETKLRIKKMNYEEETRSKNFAVIKPELKRKIEKRAKSRKEDEYWAKKKEDDRYNKMVAKKQEQKDIFDKLYINKLVDRKKDERDKKEEEIKKIKKPPINWDVVYIQTNDKIIQNQNKKINNSNKKNKTSSYFMPHRGRIYRCEDDVNEKNNINQNQKINDNKEVITKIEEIKQNESQAKEEKGKKVEKEEEKTNNEIAHDNEIINDNENVYDLKDSELVNSVNSKHSNEGEEIKEIENNAEVEEEQEKIKKSNLENDDLKQSKESKVSNESLSSKEKNILDDKNFNISPTGFRTKEIQAMIKNMNNNNSIKDLKKNNLKSNIKNSVMFFNESDDDNYDLIVSNDKIEEENNNEIEEENNNGIQKENGNKDEFNKFSDLDDLLI